MIRLEEAALPRRHILAAAAALLVALGVATGSRAQTPPAAGVTAPDEALVMRIIFTECLGYIREGRVPFQGLPTRPASAEAIAALPSRMPDRERSVELLSPRYIASWGEDADARHCKIGTAYEAAAAGSPIRLGVRAAGVLQRVTARAAEAGLTAAEVADSFSPVSISSWSEPRTGEESGPGRPVSFSLLATTPADAQGIVDAGLMVMGGPPGGRR